MVLEGIDGSGSTTQGDRLASWIRTKGRRALFTHEPSGGPAGMMIRLALSRRLRGRGGEYHAPPGEAPSASDLDPHCMALLYAADRMDHLATEIVPNLEAGRVVICDRYVMSMIAYQGLSVDEAWLWNLNKFAPRPDVCIYLDLPVEFAKDRMKRTRWTKDLYEEEEQLRIIRERFLSLANSGVPQLGKVVTIDASETMEVVAKRIRAIVSQLLEEPQEPVAPMHLSLFS